MTRPDVVLVALDREAVREWLDGGEDYTLIRSLRAALDTDRERTVRILAHRIDTLEGCPSENVARAVLAVLEGGEDG